MDAPEIVQRPNDNSRARKDGVTVDGIVVHSMAESIRLPDEPTPADEFLVEKGLSAHALIDPEGRLLVCVPDERVAFHAGISRFEGRKNLNESFLGVELLVRDPAIGVGPDGSLDYGQFLNRIEQADCYSDDQYRSLGFLCHAWEIRNPGITTDRIVGHLDVSGDDVRGAGKGKRDPGGGFNRDLFSDYLEQWRQQPDSDFDL